MGRIPIVKLESTSKNPNGAQLTLPQDGTVYGSYLYWDGILWASENSSVHIGAHAGELNRSPNTIAIGANAGFDTQEIYAISLGAYAGSFKQSQNAISIGSYAGQTNQQMYAIAIGSGAGADNQQLESIAIGQGAGYQTQGISAIAIGTNAGQVNQSINSITIGANSGQVNQGINSIAIGKSAGAYNQGNNAISIGYKAGETSQSSNSIILNATTTALNASTPGLFVSSVRGPRSSSNVLSYDTNTNEIYYNGSSERYKYDIASLSKDTSVIYDLQPREFKYKITDEPDVGLIAEEAFKCDPSFAYLDKDKIPEGIQWNVITTYLIAELKKLKMELEELGG